MRSCQRLRGHRTRGCDSHSRRHQCQSGEVLLPACLRASRILQVIGSGSIQHSLDSDCLSRLTHAAVERRKRHPEPQGDLEIGRIVHS